MPHPAIRSTLSLAAVGLLLAASWPARAESGSAAETAGNRFSFHPSIRFTTAFDDNVHLRDEHTHSDVGAFALPRVELGYEGRWFDLGADLGGDIRRYVDGSSPCQEFFRMSGFAEVGLLPGLSFRLADAFVPTPVDLGRPEDHSANLIQTNRANASLRYWSELPGDREVLVSFQAARLDTERFFAEVGNGVVDTHFHADFWEGAVVAEVQSPLYDRTSAFFRTHLRYRTFDDSKASDFGDLAVLLGVRTQWFENIDFDVAAGYGRVAFDSVGTDRFLGEVNLSYRMPGGAILRFSFVNRNTADIVGNDFMETTGRIGVERRFGEKTAASLDVFASRFDDETWDSGPDVYGGFDAGVRRQLTRRTQLELHYRYWANGGARSSDDFRENRLSVSVSYRR